MELLAWIAAGVLASPPAGCASRPAAAVRAMAGPASDRHTQPASRTLAGGGPTFMSRNWDGYTSYASASLADGTFANPT